MRESEKLDDLNRGVERISEQISKIRDDLAKKEIPDKLGWDDIVQEVIGAITFSLPFVFSGEVWDIAKELGVLRTSVIFVMTLMIGYFFISKAKLSRIAVEEWSGVPKRLVTVTVLSYLISASFIYLYGIYSLAHFNPEQYVSATVIISTFAVIGAIAVDLIR